MSKFNVSRKIIPAKHVNYINHLNDVLTISAHKLSYQIQNDYKRLSTWYFS